MYFHSSRDDVKTPIAQHSAEYRRQYPLVIQSYPLFRQGAVDVLTSLFIAVFIVVLLSASVNTVQAQTVDDLQPALELLRQTDANSKEQAIEQLAADSRSLTLLQAWQDGKLFDWKSAGRLVIGQETASGYSLVDPYSAEVLASVERSEVGKINLTNKLRGSLRKAIGQLQLNADDAETRLSAAKALAKDADDKAIALLRARLDLESDQAVHQTIEQVLLLKDIDSEDSGKRVAAINALKDHVSQDVANRLQALTEKDSDGNYLEADTQVRSLAEAALIKLQQRLQLYAASETVFFGLSLGAVLVLSAIGLAITFGVMGVINMAHGELMMLGAYTTYVMQQLLPNHLGTALLLSIPMAFLVAALVGIAIERGIIRFLYGRPLETLLATFGVSLFLQQAVRSIFSPLNRSVATPDWMSGSWQINDFLSLTWNRFYILIFCLLVFIGLLQILKRTKLGLEVRAVAQNRGMARAMGIPTARVDAMTFGLGSGIAGVAGVALSQITNVGPNLGQAYIVDSFMVVVFGGVGNLFGTLVAGFSLGIANKLLEPYAGAVLAKILVLVFIILFIQKRPRGLFPQKGRAAES